MPVTRTWVVFGVEGHIQRVSFNDSYRYDFSNERQGTRIIEVYNSDRTGSNGYSIVSITRDTFEECEDEFDGQLSDGIFENSRIGEIKEIVDNLQHICHHPSSDEYYCSEFSVQFGWFMDWLAKHDWKMEDFFDEYTWDDGLEMYKDAEADNAIESDADID